MKEINKLTCPYCGRKLSIKSHPSFNAYSFICNIDNIEIFTIINRHENKRNSLDYFKNLIRKRELGLI